MLNLSYLQTPRYPAPLPWDIFILIKVKRQPSILSLGQLSVSNVGEIHVPSSNRFVLNNLIPRAMYKLQTNKKILPTSGMILNYKSSRQNKINLSTIKDLRSNLVNVREQCCEKAEWDMFSLVYCQPSFAQPENLYCFTDNWWPRKFL